MTREDFSFFHPLRVRYAEIDAQAVVFNAHYLTYFDVGLTEYFRHIGFDYETVSAETGLDFHVIRSEIDYKLAIRFDEEVEIGVRAESWKGPRIVWQLAIFKKGEDKVRAECQLFYAVMDMNKGRPVRAPESLIKLLEATR